MPTSSFLWLNDEMGPSGVMPFLHQMASRAGAGAQRSAMQRALAADQWLSFAQAYIGGDKKHPHGTVLSINPSGSPVRSGTGALCLKRVSTVPPSPRLSTFCPSPSCTR